MKRFLNHMQLRQKFALIGVLALLSVLASSGMTLKTLSREIEAAQRELDGLYPIVTLIELIQSTQQHRGLSAALLGGDNAVAGERTAKKEQVESTLEKSQRSINDLAERSSQFKGVEQFGAIEQSWRKLSNELSNKSINVPQSFEAHTALVARQLALLDETLDASTLRLDPQASSYYLVTALLDARPQLTESLGQARAKGTPILAKGERTIEELIALNALAVATTVALNRSNSDLEHAMSADPYLRRAFERQVSASGAAGQAAVNLILENIVKPENLSFPSRDYLQQITAHIDSQYELIYLGSKLLNTAIAERVERARLHLWTFVTIGGAVIALILFIIISTIRSANVALRQALDVATAL